MLVPLNQQELQLEAKAWLARLKRHATAVSQAEIQYKQIEGKQHQLEAASRLLEQVHTLRSERARLVSRVQTVVLALRAKGGKVDTYEAYIETVSGIQADVTDASSLLSWIVAWLKAPEGGRVWGKKLLLIGVTLLGFRLLGMILGRFIAHMATSIKGASGLLGHFLATTVRNVIFLLGVLVVLSILGVQIGPLLAAFGAAGFVAGFALQGVLGNFAAGVMLLIYRPYEIGDYVSIASTSGTVSDMTLVSTILNTPDNQTVIIPNGSV